MSEASSNTPDRDPSLGLHQLIADKYRQAQYVQGGLALVSEGGQEVEEAMLYNSDMAVKVRPDGEAWLLSLSSLAHPQIKLPLAPCEAGEPISLLSSSIIIRADRDESWLVLNTDYELDQDVVAGLRQKIGAMSVGVASLEALKDELLAINELSQMSDVTTILEKFTKPSAEDRIRSRVELSRQLEEISQRSYGVQGVVQVGDRSVFCGTTENPTYYQEPIFMSIRNFGFYVPEAEEPIYLNVQVPIDDETGELQNGDIHVRISTPEPALWQTDDGRFHRDIGIQVTISGDIFQTYIEGQWGTLNELSSDVASDLIDAMLPLECAIDDTEA